MEKITLLRRRSARQLVSVGLPSILSKSDPIPEGFCQVVHEGVPVLHEGVPVVVPCP